MYPLETVVLARDENILQQLRRELASNDVTVLAEFPDAAAALAGLEPADGQRRLFLIHVRGAEDLRQLQKLVQAFPTHAVAAIVDEEHELRNIASYSPRFTDPSSSSVTRATLFCRAMRAGAMQVVTLPLDADDFRDALETLAARFGQAADSTVIAVTGVQGGCGATTVSLNLAHALSTAGHKCILAELTPHLGMLASYLDLKPEYTLPDLLAGQSLDTQAVKHALVPSSPHLSVLCGPYRDLTMHEQADRSAVTARLLAIIECLRRLAPVVILDLPAWFNEQYFEVLQHADKVLFVVEQTLPSIHNLHLIERALLPAEHQTHEYVVNRYDPKVKGLGLNDLAKLVRSPRLWKIALDPALALAVNEGRPLQQAAPRAKAVAEFAELAHALVSCPGAAERSGFWSWLTGNHSPHAVGEGGRT